MMIGIKKKLTGGWSMMLFTVYDPIYLAQKNGAKLPNMVV